MKIIQIMGVYVEERMEILHVHIKQLRFCLWNIVKTTISNESERYLNILDYCPVVQYCMNPSHSLNM